MSNLYFYFNEKYYNCFQIYCKFLKEFILGYHLFKFKVFYYDINRLVFFRVFYSFFFKIYEMLGIPE